MVAMESTLMDRVVEYPLLLAWDAVNPLPVREVQARQPSRNAPPLGLEAPPWLETGPRDRPFDFCAHAHRLIEDVCKRSADLRHVRPEQLLVAVTQARSGKRGGLQARCTPLRF